MQQEKGLRYFPIALFASVMGVSGFAMSIRLIEQVYELNNMTSNIIMIIASLMFVLNISMFFYRFINFREDVVKDFNHPVRMNFFAAISISLLLLGALYYDINTTLSFYVWLIGTIVQFLLTLIILTKLIWVHEFKLAQFNPAWFIPIVGNIVVPLVGANHASPMINWMFFSIGIVFSIIYFTIFLNRIFFQPSLPRKLTPTLFILLAPPGIGVVSYIRMTGVVDIFALIMFGFAFYLGLLFTFQIRRYITTPFFISWWAFLFPSAAVTNATILIHEHTGETFLSWIYHVQIIGLIVLTVYLFMKTIGLVMKGHLCVKED